MDEDLADRPEQWPVLDTTDLHRDDWVMALRADRVQAPDDPDGEPFTRLVLEHPGAVVVLAIDEDERVVCLRQYRHPAARRFVELPAGLLDAEGEEPVEVGRRELREEVGLEAADWTHLLTAYSSPGISSEVIYYYLARDLRDVGRGGFEPAHEEADMETLWTPYDDLLEAVLAGRVADAPVALAVLTAHARGWAGSKRPGR